MGLFDDLVPDKKAAPAAKSGMFDDLIPSTAPDYSAALSRRESGDWTDIAGRAAARVPELFGDLLELPLNVGEAAARKLGLDDTLPYRVTALGRQLSRDLIVDTLNTPGQRMDAVGMGAPSITGGDAVAAVNPISGMPLGQRLTTAGRFIGEQGIAAIPDMAAAVGAMPAYIASRTNSIAEDRAVNDDREQAGLGDFAAALPAAAVEAYLERLTTGRMLPGGTPMAGNAATRLGKEALIQAPLGGVEELASYAGTNLGTKAGVTADDALETFVGGALAEGAIGTGVQGVKELAALRGAPAPVDTALTADVLEVGTTFADLIPAKPSPATPAFNMEAITRSMDQQDENARATALFEGRDTITPPLQPVAQDAPVAPAPAPARDLEAPAQVAASVEPERPATNLFADYNPEESQSVRRTDDGPIPFTENKLTRRAVDDALSDPDPVAGAERLIRNIGDQPDIRPEQKWLADKIAPLMSAMGVKLVEPSPDKPWAGGYSNVDNTIFVRQADPEIALHEAFHGVTSALITNKAARSNPVVAKAVTELDDMLSAVAAGRGLGEIDASKYAPEIQQILNDPQGPLSNTKEFVTYGMTSRPFQDFLRSLPPPPGRTEARNMWEYFKQAVTSMFGKMTAQQRTFLDALIETGGDLTEFAAANPDVVKVAQRVESAKLTPAAELEVVAPATPTPAAAVTPPQSTPANAATPARPLTSTKNSMVEGEREARGKAPVERDAPRSNETTLEMAKAAIADNPDLPAELIARLSVSGVASINSVEEAALLVESERLRAARDRAGERAADTSLSEEARATASAKWVELEGQIDAIDQATVSAGREWGRFGQMRQRMIKKDYTLAALERKARAVKGGPLTAAESAEIKTMADTIARQQADLDAVRKQLEEFETGAAVEQTYKRLLEDMRKTARAPVNIAALKKKADAAKAALRELAGTDAATLRDVQTDTPAFKRWFGDSKVVDADGRPLVVYHGTDAEFNAFDPKKQQNGRWGKGFYFASSPERAKSYGRNVMPVYLRIENDKNGPSRDGFIVGADPSNRIFIVSDPTQIKSATGNSGAFDPNNPAIDAATLSPQEALIDLGKYHYANGAQTEAAWIKAMEADVPEQFRKGMADLFELSRLGAAKPVLEGPLTGKQVYDTVMAIVRSGVRDEAAVMKAATADIRAAHPGMDERQVRRLFTDYGKQKFPTRDADKLRVAEIRRLQKLQESIDRLKEGLAPIKPGAKREAKSAEIREREAEFASLKKAYDAKYPDAGADDGYQRSRATSIARQLAEIQARIAAGDYERAVRIPKTLNAANEQAAFELQKAKEVFLRKQFEWEMAKRTKLEKLADIGKDIMALPQPLMTSLDLSALLRQGGVIAAARPTIAIKAIPTMLRAFRSEQAAHATEERIKNSANYELMKRGGLELTTDNPLAKLSDMEEKFRSRWIEKFPMVEGETAKNVVRGAKNIATAHVRASNRAFVSTLNAMRAMAFDAMLKTWARDPANPTLAELKAISRYINIATGRGEIPGSKGQGAGFLANASIFAPRLLASRFNLLYGLPYSGGTSRTKAMVAAEYARIWAGAAVVVALGRMLWELQDDEDKENEFIGTDPRSTNFGKMRFGNAYVDPLAGFAQTTTFLARIITGEQTLQSGEVVPLRKEYRPLNLLRDEPIFDEPTFGMRDAAGEFGRFLRTKLAPWPGSIISLASGKDPVGNEVTPASTAIGLVSPLSAGDIVEIMEANGIAKSTALTMAAIFGMGVQNRDPASRAPGFDDMSRAEKDSYGAYETEASKLKAAKSKLQEFANGLGDSLTPYDMRAEIEKKADELGIEGVTAHIYKRNTTARNEDGTRKRGVHRTESGGVKLDWDEADSIKAMNEVEKSISAIDKQIEATEDENELKALRESRKTMQDKFIEEFGGQAVGEVSSRISNSERYRANYIAAQRASGGSTNLDDKQIHHIIPDNVVRKHPLMQQARKMGYDLDDARNLIGMANRTDRGALGHVTYHPRYDAKVNSSLRSAQDELVREYGSLEKAPKDAVIKAVRKVESQMRGKIQRREVPIVDNRLAEIGREESSRA